MASTQTYDSQSLTKALEQRWNYIKDIFPCEDMPVVTDAEKVPGNNSIISWDQEQLAVPSSANKRVEGLDYTYAALPTGSKLTNYVQEIMRADKVTMLNQMSFHPGIGGTEARVKRTAMVLLQGTLLDLEWTAINGTAAIGAAAVAPEAGGIKNFCAAAYTTTQTTKIITYNDDTLAPSFCTILGKNWTDGGRMDRVLVNFTQKVARFDAFSLTGYQRNTNLPANNNGVATLTYERVATAAGVVEVIPHPMVVAGEFVGYKKSMVKIVEVKKFEQDKDVARAGSSLPVVMIGWYSLYLGNQRGALKASGYTG